MDGKGDALKLKHFITIIMPRGFKSTDFLQINIDSKDWSAHESGKGPLAEDKCLVPRMKNLPANYRKGSQKYIFMKMHLFMP